MDTSEPVVSLRRPALAALHVYRLRVSLDDSTPEIWRQLDVRSDLTLDQVHTIIQAAFDWWDYHLHSFALGGEPFRPDVDRFLCPFDAEEGEWEGTPEEQVRLDETLQEVGDRLHYIYDYGDNWNLTLTLAAVLPAGDDAPVAVCTGGERAAPPEDCGSRRDAQSLAEVLPDPAAFSVAEVNAAIADENPALRAYSTLLGMPREQLERVPQRLVEMAYQLQFARLGIAERFEQLLASEPERGEVPGEPPGEEPGLEEALGAVTWFIDRAGEEGLALTAAEYLKPADVHAVAQVMPAMADWLFAVNREIDAFPVLLLREALQHYGVLRKSKGRLYATKAAQRARPSAAAVWEHLAQRLGRLPADEFHADVHLLLLLFVATAAPAEEKFPYAEVAAALHVRGWRVESGRLEVAARQTAVDADTLLANVGTRPTERSAWRPIGSHAPALARAALFARSG